MSTSIAKTTCFVCQKIQVTYICQGCSNHFCFEQLLQHRTNIQQEFVCLQNEHDQLKQQINDLKSDPMKHSFIEQIDQWEQNSIEQIKEHAQRCRIKFRDYLNFELRHIETKLNRFTEQINQIHEENAYNEIDFTDLQEKIKILNEQLDQTTNASIEEHSISLVNKISLSLPFGDDIRWKQYSTTIAGSNTPGNQLDQLNGPYGISLDNDNQMMYIADYNNHRILQCNLGSDHRGIVAGGNGEGDRLDQLSLPTDVTIDQENNDLIIVDRKNRRVMRWSLQSNSTPQILIDDINCSRLAMHEDGTLYVSNWKNNEVRRWKKGETHGTIVAGGNGDGNQLNQLCFPTFLFVDDDHTLYISDYGNHRVMKWVKDATEGIVVAGGNGQGNRLTQLSRPQGVIVNGSDQIYVADFGNDRVMRWCEGETEGRIVVGADGQGQEKNLLNHPVGLSFDIEGNLYVADWQNHRIEKFERDFD